MFTVILVTACLITYAITEILKTDDVKFNNQGKIKAVNIRIFWPNGENLTFIDWGVVDSGSVNNVSVYAKNEGNVPITLKMTINQWNPANAESFLRLEWNYTKRLIEPSHVIPIKLSLVVDKNITNIKNFSFTATISGVG